MINKIGYKNHQGQFIPARGNIVHNLAGKGLRFPTMKPLSANEAERLTLILNENTPEEIEYLIVKE